MICLTGCREDEFFIDDQPIQDPIVNIEIPTTGEVLDLYGAPIQNAVITMGNNVTETDEFGRFKLSGLVSGEKAVISVSKTGYFSGYPVFYPERNVGQHVRVQLQERRIAGRVNANNKIIAVAQHNINFSEASFKDENGNPYSGEVTVYASYLDPIDENLRSYMPGDLVGININDEEQLLKSFGMLNVELEDAQGNPLDIEGEAELSMEIPSQLIGEAPATIPLWYFDESTGNWIEEGEATLEGNLYVGTVKHFSLWNCDAPLNLVTISGGLDTPIAPSSFFIKVSRLNGDVAYTTLNEAWRFKGKVPANESLILEVLDICENVLIRDPIDPLSQDQDLGVYDLVESNPIMNTITVSGNAIGCDLEPITNGYVNVAYSNGTSEVIELESDGTFSNTYVWCSDSEISITAFDRDERKKSETIVFDQNTNISFDDLVTCEDIVQGLFISGQTLNKFIPASTEFDTITLTHHQMTCTDILDNGDEINYTLNLVNWSEFINNPALTLFLTNSTNQTLEITWEFNTASSPIIHSYSVLNGELIDLTFRNVTLTLKDLENGTSEELPDHTLRVVGYIDI